MAKIANVNFFEQVSEQFAANDPEVGSKQRESAHVRCIQLLYHAIARGAFSESLELTTDDFVLEILGPRQSPFNGRWEGRDNVLAAMQRNFALVEEQLPAIQSVVAQGDIVIIVARETGRMTDSSGNYDVHWVQEFSFADGRLRQIRQIIDGGSAIGGDASEN